MDYILRKYSNNTFYSCRNKKIPKRLVYSNLNCLQYFLSRLDKNFICEKIALYGNLDLLKWARWQSPPYPWDSCTSARCARRGHLDVLKWARENGCPWNSWTSSMRSSSSLSVASSSVSDSVSLTV